MEALAGTQTPFGAHKGSALSLMVELLAGAFTGSDLAIDGGRNSEASGMHRGMLLLAIDPAASNGACEAAERLFELMEQEEGVRLPASERYKKRSLADKEGGILVDRGLFEECFGEAGGSEQTS